MACAVRKKTIGSGTFAPRTLPCPCGIGLCMRRCIPTTRLRKTRLPKSSARSRMSGTGTRSARASSPNVLVVPRRRSTSASWCTFACSSGSGKSSLLKRRVWAVKRALKSSVPSVLYASRSISSQSVFELAPFGHDADRLLREMIGSRAGMRSRSAIVSISSALPSAPGSREKGAKSSPHAAGSSNESCQCTSSTRPDTSAHANADTTPGMRLPYPSFPPLT
mmetsp:Transcript_5334/g.18523  ORF Transcript_5334/g.18523 Transcript_5334/m.18523 type:complete len:222 (+) Transcript_5334:653-1318(+)